MPKMSLKPGVIPKRGVLNDFGVFDVETCVWSERHPEEIIPKLISYYDLLHPQGMFFDDPNPEEMVRDFLRFYFTSHERRSPFVCFAHNGGCFDFIPLIETLLEDPYFVKNELLHMPKMKRDPLPVYLMYSDGRILEMQLKGKNSESHVFRDSIGIIHGSLDYLTSEKGFDVPHKKWDEKRVKKLFKTEYRDNMEQWQEYCLNDCVGTYEVIDKFKHEIAALGGVVLRTIAKTAFSGLFQARYLKTELPTYFEYNKLIRSGFTGGRNEIFHLYVPPVEGVMNFDLDYNSLYPYVMRNNLFPTGVPIGERGVSEEEYRDKCCIVRATVTVPETEYVPFFPWRAEKLFFPVGTFTGVWDGVTILEGLKRGYDIKVDRVWMFSDCDYIFKDYIDHLWKERKYSKGAKRQTLKLCMNSTYGKTVQRDEMDCICHIENLPKSVKEYKMYNEEYDIVKYTKHSRAPYMLPGIGSHVTALAQQVLLKGIDRIHNHKTQNKPDGGKVFYVDTDSLMTDVKIETGEELGMLKEECQFETAIFLLPKTYMLYNVHIKNEKEDDVIKMKGFDLDERTRRRIKWDTFERALKNRDYSGLSLERMKPALFRTLLRLWGNTGEFTWTTRVHKKNLVSFYDKRYVLSDFSTKPLVVDEGKFLPYARTSFASA